MDKQAASKSLTLFLRSFRTRSLVVHLVWLLFAICHNLHEAVEFLEVCRKPYTHIENGKRVFMCMLCINISLDMDMGIIMC